MAKQTTLYVAILVLVLVILVSMWASHHMEGFIATPSGVTWCSTSPSASSCVTKANPSCMKNVVSSPVSSLKIYPGYQAQTSSKTTCGGVLSSVYAARGAPYNINGDVKCIMSGPVNACSASN